jgi:hypothetical protein
MADEVGGICHKWDICYEICYQSESKLINGVAGKTTGHVILIWKFDIFVGHENHGKL